MDLDPFEFRMELAKLFQSEGRFKMGKMEDPIEALLAIINAIHSYSIGEKHLKECDKPCNPSCLAHQLFWINIYEEEVILIHLHNYYRNVNADLHLKFYNMTTIIIFSKHMLMKYLLFHPNEIF